VAGLGPARILLAVNVKDSHERRLRGRRGRGLLPQGWIRFLEARLSPASETA